MRRAYIIQFILFAAPWLIRRRILNMLGFRIAAGARIGYSILDVGVVSMAAGSRIGHLCLVSGLKALELQENALIGNLNWITARMSFRGVRRSELLLSADAAITNRHYIDCNSNISIGKFTTIAGVRSQFFTHSVNLWSNVQEYADISIGSYCFIGSGVIVMPGVILPDNSILAAGSVVRHSMVTSRGAALYSGNPASLERDLNDHNVNYFRRGRGVVEPADE